MTTVRAAKAKGSAFERDCNESLLPVCPSIYLTHHVGFQLMFDLVDDVNHVVFECKRLKGISWNQLVRFYEKLQRVRPQPHYDCYLLFKSNQQPCLVFYGEPGHYRIELFEDKFKTPFIKHKPVKRNKKQ